MFFIVPPRYFLSNIRRVSDPSFVPEDPDILQVRVKTTGVIEYNFENKEGKEFIMVRIILYYLKQKY